MKFLLDTHALIWWLVNSPRLSAAARAVIANPDNEIFVSAASAWEVATKVRLGKWQEAEGLTGVFGKVTDANGFTPLALTAQHAIYSGSLNVAHADPFDRMLAAQAELESLSLITVDPAFAAFNVRTCW